MSNNSKWDKGISSETLDIDPYKGGRTGGNIFGHIRHCYNLSTLRHIDRASNTFLKQETHRRGTKLYKDGETCFSISVHNKETPTMFPMENSLGFL